jgi:hypothetical protein
MNLEDIVNVATVSYVSDLLLKRIDRDSPNYLPGHKKTIIMFIL